MPREKNKLARIAVPLIMIAVAALVVVAIGVNSGRKSPAPDATAQQTAPDSQTQSTDTLAEDGPEALPEAPIEPSIAAAPESVEPEQVELTADRAELGELRARVVPAAEFTPIGGIDPDGESAMLLEFAEAGAGVEAITLARYFFDVDQTEHYTIQRKQSIERPAGPAISVVSLAARAVVINGQVVDLYSTTRGPIWRETAPGAFEAIIENEAGDEIALIAKRYTLPPNSYDIHVNQELVNLTALPLDVEWIQYGPVDLPEDTLGYGGDTRRVRFGYLLNTRHDPSQQIVQTERRLHRRSSVISDPEDEFGRVWPTQEALDESLSLVWAAMTNRYFAFVTHPTIDEAAATSNAPINKTFDLAAGRIDRVVVGGDGRADSGVVVLQLRSRPFTVAPGESLNLGLSAYTGPKWGKTLRSDPVYSTLGLHKLIVFNFGGPCAFCTFQPLARGLLYFLGFFHDVLFRDWALAIMFLVVCVRGVLHPITKRSQIAVQRFGKQMQALAPKQKKLQEKYRDDPKRMKEEMAKLMREEGVNFTGALGCLPMFLQSPIWIALYAMLFFAFDLRHEPAFFGAFQAITGGAWDFLRDLSAPDRFISFGAGFDVPLMGHISSLNLLPILLGVVFYIHQKYMTPPPSASMTPEQQTQQKIVKVMMVVMFPLFMYNAPSGLSLYFITNSALGIVESRYIRSHVDKLDLEPKKPSPMRKRVENLRQQAAARSGQPPRSYKQRKK